MMSSLTRWVLSHKRTVVLAWVVLTIAGIAAAGPASNALEPEFSVPDKEGWETNVSIQERYRGTGGESPPLVPVVTIPEGESVDSPAVKRDLEAIDARLERALPGSRVASYASTGDDTFVSDDGRTTYALVHPTPTRTRSSARTRAPSGSRAAPSRARPSPASP
jgi:putative drug exporter of the RND superfamily